MKFQHFILFLLLCSCAEDPSNTRHDSIEKSKDSMRAYTDSVLRKDKYCFQNPEDGLQFVPDSVGLFGRTHDELAQYTGSQAENTRLYVEYDNGYGHVIKVRIMDYCAVPEMIAVDYSLKYDMHKSTTEFNEFDIPPSHHGFVTLYRNEAYLLVEVDDRFLVEIEDHDAENTKDVLAFYGSIPIDKLAQFGQ